MTSRSKKKSDDERREDNKLRQPTKRKKTPGGSVTVASAELPPRMNKRRHSNRYGNANNKDVDIDLDAIEDGDADDDDDMLRLIDTPEPPEATTNNAIQNVSNTKDVYQPSCPIPDNHIPHKYKYLSSAISLRTTDEAISTQLLTGYYKHIYSANNLKPSVCSFHQQNGKILAEISNVLTQNECIQIIEGNKKMKFQRMNQNKYDKNIRKSDRLLILDQKLSTLLSNKLLHIINQEIISKHNVPCVPLGFGVLNGNQWLISSINNGMRINRYSSQRNDFFGYHKDAQFCDTPNQRSIFTLIIYLNDDFTAGETKFYFEKSAAEKSETLETMNGLTMKEEIELNGGIDHGYDCMTIQPKQCYAALFSHNLIHEGCKLFGKNETKYILKTDIVVARKAKTIGFAISSLESVDYKRCLNYFVEAQRNELNGNKIKANELYERSLSIRYSYPRKLVALQNDMDDDTTNECVKLLIEITDIWFIIFAFSHAREVGFCVSLFPRQLYDIYLRWKLQGNVQIGYEAFSKHSPFIPTVIKSYGLYTRLLFPSLRFYKDNREACLRVAAIYTLYLMSHRNNARYFVVEYDSFTQNILAIPLKKLLADVFYGRQCNGKYFKIKSMIDDQPYVDQDVNMREDGNYDEKNESVQVPLINTTLTKIFRKELFADKIVSNQLNNTFHDDNVYRKLFEAYKNVLALGMELNYYSWNGLDKIKKIISKKQDCVATYYEKYNSDRLHQEFNQQIDRDYMSITHGAQFLGGVGILTDSKFYYDCKQAKQRTFDDMKQDFTKVKYYYRSKYPYCLMAADSYSRYFDMKWEILKQIDDKNILDLGSKPAKRNSVENENERDYFNDISNADLNIHKTRITKGSNDRCRKMYDVKLYNNLIFDFERKNMKIIENDCANGACEYCLKFNNDTAVNDIISAVMGKDYSNTLHWVKTKYKAKFEVQLQHIGNVTKSLIANMIANINSQLSAVYNFRILSCNVDNSRRYVTIEFTLTNGWVDHPQNVESVEKMLRCALKTFYGRDFNREYDHCTVEMLHEGYIDDEIRTMKEIKNSIKYYVINIENLINNDGGYDISYNHAAANCGVCRVSNTSWNSCDEYYNFKFAHYSGYSHMDHLHVATVEDVVDNKLFLWVSYNGIAAL